MYFHLTKASILFAFHQNRGTNWLFKNWTYHALIYTFMMTMKVQYIIVQPFATVRRVINHNVPKRRTMSQSKRKLNMRVNGVDTSYCHSLRQVHYGAFPFVGDEVDTTHDVWRGCWDWKYFVYNWSVAWVLPWAVNEIERLRFSGIKVLRSTISPGYLF